jgi:hypothetical protein
LAKFVGHITGKQSYSLPNYYEMQETASAALLYAFPAIFHLTASELDAIERYLIGTCEAFFEVRSHVGGVCTYFAHPT